MLGLKRQLSQKLPYLPVSKLKKRSRNREKLFNFLYLVLLKGSTFHLNDKKISDIGTLNFVTVNHQFPLFVACKRGKKMERIKLYYFEME